MRVRVGAERRTTLAAGSLAGAMLLAAGTALVAASAHRRPATTRAELRALADLPPFAVSARQRLARLDLAAGRPRAADARLGTALRLAPFSATLWLERGEAALRSGDVPRVRRAAFAARRRAPVDPAVCHRAALLLLQAGATDEALPALRCVVGYASERAVEVFDLAHAVYGDDALIARRIVPPDAAGARLFLGWAYRRANLAAATAGWDVLAAHGPASTDVVRHVDFLLQRSEVAAADARWTAAFGPRDAGVVFDGGFEREHVEGGFGWYLRDADGARVRVAGGEAAVEGRRGLAVEFAGGNVAFSHVAQVVPVAAGRRYRLTARVKSAGITSLAGPRLEVEPHASCPALTPAGTSEIRGTTPWTPVSVDFTTPPACGAVTFRVRRRPSTRLDRDLRGRLWLDDVRLTDVGEADGAGEGAENAR